jgi:thiosulfate/3-mercaptopyruvate sulfurtransferase
MLKAAGFENAAVLDGGFSLWKAEGRPVETGSRDYPAVDTLPLTERPGTWADTNEVLAAIGDGDVCTINALAPEVHRGEGDTNYGRKGRIKGSVNVSSVAMQNCVRCSMRWGLSANRASSAIVVAVCRPRWTR